jgi:hypothetical protein
MARRQMDQLDTPSVEICVVANEEDVGPLAPKTSEGRIDLAAGAGDLQPHGAGSRLHVSQRGLGIDSICRIDEHGNASGCGTSLRRSSSRCAVNSALKILIPVT